MFESVLLEFVGLLGFAALVSLIVNVLKLIGVVKDGTSDKWVAGFNLAGVLALYLARIFIPEFDPLPIDSILAEAAVVGGHIFTFIVMIFGSKLTYTATRGLPIIGKSYSLTE